MFNDCYPSDVNRRLSEACRTNDVRVALDAIEKGADVNLINADSGQAPLHVACANRYINLIKMLLDKQANPNIQTIPYGSSKSFATGRTPAMMAVDNIEVLNSLLQKSLQLGIQNSNGDTVLHMAARRAMWPNILLLLRVGAPLELRNRWDRTPLDEVVLHDRHEIHAAWLAYDAAEKARHVIESSTPSTLRPL